MTARTPRTPWTPRPTRLLVTWAALALLLPGVGALDAAAAEATRPAVTDAAGDANGTDARHLDGRAPAGTTAVPASDAGRDLRRVALSRRGADLVVGLDLTAAPEGAVHVEVRITTPACDAVVLTWVTGHGALLQGCRGNQRRTWDGMRAVAGGLELAVPLAELPRWFAPGTPVSSLTATTSRWTDVRAGALVTAVDVASGPTSGSL